MFNSRQDGYMLIIALVLVVCILGALLFAGNFIKSKSSENNDKQIDSSANQTPEDNKVLIHQDTIAGTLLAYYLSNKVYPTASEAGWVQFVAEIRNNIQHNNIDSVDPFTDPLSGKDYVFTSSEPEFGEIEYRFPASCNSEANNFLVAKRANNYAFRLKLPSGKLSCYGNL